MGDLRQSSDGADSRRDNWSYVLLERRRGFGLEASPVDRFRGRRLEGVRFGVKYP